MKLNRLAIITSIGFIIGTSAVEASAYDWQAAKTQAFGYYDAYAERFLENKQVQAKVLEVHAMAANIESRERIRNGRTKSLLKSRELDFQRRRARATASDALSNLRLYYLYGNLLPRILNEFDDGFVKQGMPRPFAVRPLLIQEPQFKSEQTGLIAQIGLPPNEIDPKPAQ